MPTRSSAARRPSPGDWGLLVASALALLALAGCGDKPQQGAAAAAPPPSVVAVPAKREAVTEQAVFVGRVAAVERVDLRARVEGFLQERRFTEGQPVAVGDVLFVIEPEQYQSIVSQREADLAKARADQENAAAQLRRGEELLKDKNISAAEVDKLRAAESIAKAGVAQAQAALDAARLDLSYTQIKAPVAGRIGLAKYTVGNLVGPGSGSLATLVSTDPIYVQFPVTQRERLKARQDIASQGGTPQSVSVLARLPDGSLFDHKKRLDFVDVTTDPGTDTVTVRASFPNPKGTLVDGQFVGVLIQGDTPELGITVPQSALLVDQQGTYVLLIDGANKAQVRRVQVGPALGPRIAVSQGLEEGDLVIVEGSQKVRPGQVVSATPAQEPEGGATP